MKRILTIILNWLKLQRIRFQMRETKLDAAIKKAKKLHAETGQRYRVFFFGGKYHAWNRWDIRRQQASGLLKRGKKVGADFDRICFFDTNSVQTERAPSLPKL